MSTRPTSFEHSGAVPQRAVLISRLSERTSIIAATKLALSEWPSDFGGAHIPAALLDPLSRQSGCGLVETGDESWGSRSSAKAEYPLAWSDCAT